MDGTVKAYWIILLCANAAAAQHVVGARAGTVDLTIGEVSADGQPLRATQTNFPLLRDGRRIRTGDGRLELLLAPGVFLRLGERGALRMIQTRPMTRWWS